jgi:hypothetical protein
VTFCSLSENFVVCGAGDPDGASPRGAGPVSLNAGIGVRPNNVPRNQA